MSRLVTWHRINAQKLDRKVFGPAVAAFQHAKLPDTLLLHLKFRSRNHPKYRQLGTWAVVVGTKKVGCKHYRFKAINKPPMTWANRILREDAAGVFEREAAERRRELETFLRDLRRERAERAQLEMKESGHASPLDRVMRECYEKRIGPLNPVDPAEEPPAPTADLEDLPFPFNLHYVDDRRKRHRSVVNYHRISGPDELPTKLVAMRRWSGRGRLRHDASREAQRRRRRKRRAAVYIVKHLIK